MGARMHSMKNVMRKLQEVMQQSMEKAGQEKHVTKWHPAMRIFKPARA